MLQPASRRAGQGLLRGCCWMLSRCLQMCFFLCQRIQEDAPSLFRSLRWVVVIPEAPTAGKGESRRPNQIWSWICRTALTLSFLCSYLRPPPLGCSRNPGTVGKSLSSCRFGIPAARSPVSCTTQSSYGKLPDFARVSDNSGSRNGIQSGKCRKYLLMVCKMRLVAPKKIV